MRKRGSPVSAESCADGFISKFKNTDRRDGGEGRATCTLTGTCDDTHVHAHRRRHDSCTLTTCNQLAFNPFLQPVSFKAAVAQSAAMDDSFQ